MPTFALGDSDVQVGENGQAKTRDKRHVFLARQTNRAVDPLLAAID